MASIKRVRAKGILIPRDLLKTARALGLNVSRIAASALREEVLAATTHRYRYGGPENG